MLTEEQLRAMRLGLDTFNRGEFFEAHEHWEQVWDVIDDPERRWVQGLIQIATGLHKLDRGRSDVCSTLLERAVTKLEGSADTFAGIDLAHARAQAEQVLAAIGRGELPRAQDIQLRAS